MDPKPRSGRRVRSPLVRMVVRTLSWVLLFASLGATAAAWFTPTPVLDADDAVDVAVGALAEAGVDAEPVERPELGIHESEQGSIVDAWVVRVEVDVDGTDETIELRVQESAGQLVYVDDRVGDDDMDRLLTDEQFRVLGSYRDETLADAWVLRNGAATAATAILTVTCFFLATRSERLWSTR